VGSPTSGQVEGNRDLAISESQLSLFNRLRRHLRSPAGRLFCTEIVADKFSLPENNITRFGNTKASADFSKITLEGQRVKGRTSITPTEA
jgi:hypothetical protein